MNPLADKVLTAAAFIVFLESGDIPAWIVVILAREFLVTGLRGVAASEGVVIAAGPAGKQGLPASEGVVVRFMARCRISFRGGPTHTAREILITVRILILMYLKKYTAKNARFC
jgi:phosphatidylglycerophosphate synthase